MLERYEYDAYGKVKILNADFTDDADNKSDYVNPYYFTGRRLDELDNGNLKLMYYRSRYYDTATGRFFTHDPIIYIDGMNPYEYIGSNPVIKLDPSGLHPIPGTIWNPLGPQFHPQCLDGHKHIWMGSGWSSTIPCSTEVHGRGSARACVHGGYWKCVGHCTLEVVVGAAVGDFALSTLKAAVQKAAKSVAKKWVLIGLPFVRDISTVRTAYGTAKCFVDCWKDKTH